MSNEYVWNLQPWDQLLLWIGGAFTYVICGGFTWALVPERWDGANVPVRGLAALGWPITVIIYIVYSAAMIGPRTIAYRRKRNRLPRADVRRQ